MNTMWRGAVKPLLMNGVLRRGSLQKCITCISTSASLDYVNMTKSITHECPFNLKYYAVRQKSKKQSAQESDDEGDNFDEDSSLSKDSKVVKFNTTSLRTDLILKSALGVARNKIEQLFYESKIRINGKKILKKSLSVKIGDEIDVIKAISPKNSEHLYISRIEVLNLVAKEDNIVVTARRFKTLLIENYETDPYKGSADNEE